MIGSSGTERYVGRQIKLENKGQNTLPDRTMGSHGASSLSLFVLGLARLAWHYADFNSLGNIIVLCPPAAPDHQREYNFTSDLSLLPCQLSVMKNDCSQT